jgi:hypothetical protein
MMETITLSRRGVYRGVCRRNYTAAVATTTITTTTVVILVDHPPVPTNNPLHLNEAIIAVDTLHPTILVDSKNGQRGTSTIGCPSTSNITSTA